METAMSSQWKNTAGTMIAAIMLIFVTLIIGPLSVLLAVLLQRGIARIAPPWDPDRYWESMRGYTFAGILIYLILVVRFVLLNTPPDQMLSQLLTAGLDGSVPALFHKWTAGLLFLPALCLLQERTQPRTDRYLHRMLTSDEQETLKAKIKTKTIPQQEEDSPLDPAKLDKRTECPRVPDDAPMKQMAREEQERNQFLKDEARRMSKPKPKKPKQDKGDGSMDELL